MYSTLHCPEHSFPGNKQWIFIIQMVCFWGVSLFYLFYFGIRTLEWYECWWVLELEWEWVPVCEWVLCVVISSFFLGKTKTTTLNASTTWDDGTLNTRRGKSIIHLIMRAFFFPFPFPFIYLFIISSSSPCTYILTTPYHDDSSWPHCSIVL